MTHEEPDRVRPELEQGALVHVEAPGCPVTSGGRVRGAEERPDGTYYLIEQENGGQFMAQAAHVEPYWNGRRLGEVVLVYDSLERHELPSFTLHCHRDSIDLRPKVFCGLPLVGIWRVKRPKH